MLLSIRAELNHHDYLPIGLICVHHPVRLSDVLEPEHARRFHPVAAGRNVGGDRLKRDVPLP